MMKYKIRMVTVTMIFISRQKLITKERMESFYNEKGINGRKESVNDDLESMMQDLQLGRSPYKFVRTYFLPKLTEKELKLVEQEDFNYQDTLWYGRFGMGKVWVGDVDEDEMKASESDSKFVEALGDRRTFAIWNWADF